MTAALITMTKGAGNAPDLGDPDENDGTLQGGQRRFYTRSPDGFLALLYLGDVPQGGLYWGYGGADVSARLNALSGRGITVRGVAIPPNLSGPQRGVLTAAGIEGIERVSDGALLGLWPPVVMAGQDPLTEGLGEAPDPDEEYVRAPL